MKKALGYDKDCYGRGYCKIVATISNLTGEIVAIENILIKKNLDNKEYYYGNPVYCNRNGAKLEDEYPEVLDILTR